MLPPVILFFYLCFFQHLVHDLIGNKPVAKKLMAYLRDYQKEHNYQFLFGTEASLNLAQDDETQ